MNIILWKLRFKHDEHINEFLKWQLSLVDPNKMRNIPEIDNLKSTFLVEPSPSGKMISALYLPVFSKSSSRKAFTAMTSLSPSIFFTHRTINSLSASGLWKSEISMKSQCYLLYRFYGKMPLHDRNWKTAWGGRGAVVWPSNIHKFT